MSHPIQSRPTPWTTIILVCGKCSRKLDGGYGPDGDIAFRSALKDELKERGYRHIVRIVETKCFGLCPKKAVVAVNASAPGNLLIIPRRTGIDKALRRLVDVSEDLIILNTDFFKVDM
jgi:hypothetical protein